MTATPIQPPARSLRADLDEALCAQIDALAGRVAAGANWKVRRKTLFDLIGALEVLAAMTDAQRAALVRRLDERGGTPPPDPEAPGEAEAGAPPPPAEALILFYTGAILERLGEERIATPEQALAYSLSIHPEHGQSVIDWMNADIRNAKALRKLMRADRAYRALVGRIDAAVGPAAGEAAGEADGDIPDGPPDVP